jgi:hypothetical protein
MKKGTTRRADEYVEAPAEVVYEPVADVTRMGEWSPECVGAEWLDGNTGPTVGARFGGHNRHRRARWSNKPRVVVERRGQEFAFVANDPLGHDTTLWTTGSS